MRPQPNAWLRSTIRSSGSSIPTEMRISVGVIPSRNRSSSGMSECVIAAGCEASVSVPPRSEEHTSELQSRRDLVCRLLLEKKKKKKNIIFIIKKKKTKKQKKKRKKTK